MNVKENAKSVPCLTNKLIHKCLKTLRKLTAQKNLEESVLYFSDLIMSIIT